MSDEGKDKHVGFEQEGVPLISAPEVNLETTPIVEPQQQQYYVPNPSQA
jgi:hypothetical protein